MSTFDQPDTLADRLARQGVQPVSDPTPLPKPRKVSKALSGEPGNAKYWAEKRRKQRKWKGGKAA